MQVFTDTRLNKCACICGKDVFSKCQSTVQLIFTEKSNVLGTSQLAVFMAPRGASGTKHLISGFG